MINITLLIIISVESEAYVSQALIDRCISFIGSFNHSTSSISHFLKYLKVYCGPNMRANSIPQLFANLSVWLYWWKKLSHTYSNTFLSNSSKKKKKHLPTVTEQQIGWDSHRLIGQSDQSKPDAKLCLHSPSKTKGSYGTPLHQWALAVYYYTSTKMSCLVRFGNKTA